MWETDQPETKVFSHTTLMKTERDDLRNFALNFCHIVFPNSWTKEQMVESLLIRQANGGAGADRFGQLVAQVRTAVCT